MSELDTPNNALLAGHDKTVLLELGRGLIEMPNEQWTLFAPPGPIDVLDNADIAAEWVEPIEAEGDTENDPSFFNSELARGLRAKTSLERIIPAHYIDTLSRDKRYVGAKTIDNFPVFRLLYADFLPIYKENKRSVVLGAWAVRAIEDALDGGKLIVTDQKQCDEVLKRLRNKTDDDSEFRERLRRDAKHQIDKYRERSNTKKFGRQAVLHVHGKLHTAFHHGDTNLQRNAGLFIKNPREPLGMGNFELQFGKAAFKDIGTIDFLTTIAAQLAASLDANSIKTRRDLAPAIALLSKNNRIHGAGIGESPESAFINMFKSKTASLGNYAILVSFKITEDIAKMFFHDSHGPGMTLVGSGITKGALRVLEAKGALRIPEAKEGLNIYTNPALGSMSTRSVNNEPEIHSTWGGFSEQDSNRFILNFNSPEVRTSDTLTNEQVKRDLILAFGIGRAAMDFGVTTARKDQLGQRSSGEPTILAAIDRACDRIDINGHAVYVSGPLTHEFAINLIRRRLSSIAFHQGEHSARALQAFKQWNIPFVRLPEKSERP